MHFASGFTLGPASPQQAAAFIPYGNPDSPLGPQPPMVPPGSPGMYPPPPGMNGVRDGRLGPMAMRPPDMGLQQPAMMMQQPYMMHPMQQVRMRQGVVKGGLGSVHGRRAGSSSGCLRPARQNLFATAAPEKK